MDAGILQASRQTPRTPLPSAWLSKLDAPAPRPDWAIIGALTSTQHRSLLAQIAYDLSQWNYAKIGPNNELGAYQFNVQTLESYGLLVAGSYSSYGLDAVNYQHCWASSNNTYAEYLIDITSQQEFLLSKTAQELLAYQRLLDLYTSSLRSNVIKINDTNDTVAGMLSVAWRLGVGAPPTVSITTGTGAFAWRHYNVGAGDLHYNAGRYSTIVLSSSQANNTPPTKVDTQTVAATPVIIPAPTVTTANTDGAMLPSLGTLTQGVTNSAILEQQLQTGAINLVSGVVNSAANGVIGGLAEGLGQNGGAIVNLAVAAIQNPQTLVATATNKAATYAMQQVGSVVTDLSVGSSGWIKDTAAESSFGVTNAFSNNKLQLAIMNNLDNMLATQAFGNVVAGEFGGNVQF